MQINPINIYKMTSFGKEKDEFQPLSEPMREIFRENIVPKSRQRILWELSEVPDFYEASKTASKQELLEIADFMDSQRTNILQMALDGDVQLIKKAKDGTTQTYKLLSLKAFVRQNQSLPEGRKKRLIDFLRSHFVAQVEEDAIMQKLDTKEYPKGMRYIKEKSNDGKVSYARINDGTACLKSIVGALTTGSPIDDNDLGVIFEEDIQTRKGSNRGFTYEKINPETVESEYAVAYPAVYRAIEENREVPSEIRDNVAQLRRIPYFRNLTRDTYPQNLFMFSKLNLIMNNLLTKMLKQEITLDVRNPINGEYVKTPIIDIGKLLLEKREGKISEKQIDEIVKNHTLAFELCSLYAAARDKLAGQEIKSIEMQRFGNSFGFVALSKSGDKVPECLDANNETIQKLLAALDKLPFKKAVLNFESKK
ncbi:MAG: hypothetical protein K6A44_02440 [bacterium]|nr:hypothetical protein [bacterium]